MYSNVNVRRMEERDLDRVVEIEESIFTLPWSREGFISAISMKDNLFVVITVDDEVQGYAGYYGSFGEGEITNVAINKAMHNKGLGQKLMYELLGIAKEEGMTRIILEVRVSNESAIHVYEKLGFTSLGIRKDFYEHPREDALIMEISI